MEKEEAENYIKSGKILQKVVEKSKKSIKPGQKLLEIALNVEKSIKTLGSGAGKPAFPVNLSVNENAAHFTPGAGEEAVLEEQDVLKVDVGVHVDGYITDTAFTLNFDNKYGKMIEAVEEALEAGLSVAKAGTELGKIGAEIEKVIRGKGFRPVQNLTGHGLERFEQHAPPSIPNIGKRDSRKLEEGHAYALEPFATDGRGWVKEGQQSEIFALEGVKPVRNEHARALLEFVAEKYETLPFAERWIARELKLSDFQRKIALRELMKAKCIRAFPVLHEEAGKVVAQAEKSVLLFDGKAVRLC